MADDPSESDIERFLNDYRCALCMQPSEAAGQFEKCSICGDEVCPKCRSEAPDGSEVCRGCAADLWGPKKADEGSPF
jgi:hypothetical protein